MKIHFIAIGGSAMHNLAIALSKKGYHVTGSDDEIFEPSYSRLNNYGLLPERIGWFKDNIHEGLDSVILGMHAKADNPELLRARDLGLRIFSYPEFLYEQAKKKTRIVIGGSHGKTTITAMILHAANYHNIETDYMVGAQLEGFDVMVKLTDEAPFMVLEGDEYLSSPLDRRPKFHLYKPHISVISGIAWDHINVFPTFENYLEQFRLFIYLTEKNGKIIYCHSDEVLKNLVQTIERTDISYYPYELPDFEIHDGTTCISSDEVKYPVQIFGRHNLLNLSAAMNVCRHLGITDGMFFKAMESFKGASNRLQLLVRSKNVVVYKDFAHAPSKLKATTSAVKEQFPERNLIACMELHTFSSLSKKFLSHYDGAMEKADYALVYYDLHALQLKRLPQIQPEEIANAFGGKNIEVFNDAKKLKERILELKRPHASFVFMSSGNFGNIDINKLASELIN